jgi:copper resistance protein B
MAMRRAEQCAFVGATALLLGSCAAPIRPVADVASGWNADSSLPPASEQESDRGAYEEPIRQAQAPGPSQERWPAPVEDQARFGFLIFDQLEYRAFDHGADAIRWDAQGWYGGDYNRLWFRSEGESTTSGQSATGAESQILYSRMIAPFWDVQVGLRHELLSDSGVDESRWSGVLGLQGFAPYRFDVEPALFLGEDGVVQARLTATTDWLITQRLIVQPRFEAQAGTEDIEEFGIGKGLEYMELGVRLRYEVYREFAPYVGIEWERLFGDTADFARSGGEEASARALVFGVRVWL